MNTELAFVTRTIRLRGHRFPAGCIVRVWKTGKVISIQPFNLPTPSHSVLWYALPLIREKHLRPLTQTQCTLAEWELYTIPKVNSSIKTPSDIKNYNA